jgi:hypothetical protein
VWCTELGGKLAGVMGGLSSHNLACSLYHMRVGVPAVCCVAVTFHGHCTTAPLVQDGGSKALVCCQVYYSPLHSHTGGWSVVLGSTLIIILRCSTAALRGLGVCLVDCSC